MRRGISYPVAGVCALCLSSAATPVLAQGADYAPKGLPLGAFRAFPTVYMGILHDNNIYREGSGTVSDTYYNLGGELSIESNWSQHMLNLRGSLTHLQYDSRPDEDRTAWELGAEGRIDIQRGSALNLSASHTRQFEARNNPNTGVSPVNPIQYDVTNFSGSFRYMPARIGLEVGANYAMHDFANSSLTGGGFLSNRDRDHDQFSVYGKASYAASPDYAVFGRVGYNERSFDLAIDRSGVNRDSSGYSADLGVDLAVTRIVQGNLFVGYFNQDYRAPLSDVQGFRFGGAIDWFPTNLITVHLAASHALVDTTLIGVSTSEQSQVGIDIDYELLRQLLVNVGANYIFADFDGSGREDSYIELVGGLKYYMNNYVSAGASYRYTTRDSSVAGQDYDASIFGANVSLHL